MVVITVPTNVSATTYYVGPTRTYRTIGAALAVARNYDTIYVDAATYTERFTITQIGLNLIGAGASTTTIDGTAGGDVVTVTADDVTIKEFTIKNSGPAWGDSGIELAGSPSNKITGCQIYQIDLDQCVYGVHLYHAEDNTIGRDSEYMNIKDNICGIVLSNSGREVGSTVYKNIIKKIHITSTSTTNSEDDGIYLVNSNYNEFYNIDISQDWDCWWDGAVDLIDSSNNIFDHITIVENQEWYWPPDLDDRQGDGFFLYGNCNSNTIKNSDIKNSRNGITLANWGIKKCNNNIIQYNDIHDNNQSGIWLDHTDLNTIENNDIYNNSKEDKYWPWKGGHGICSEASTYNTIRGNMIFDNDMDLNNDGDGICLTSNSNDNIIEENEIYNTLLGNQQYGVHLKQSLDNIILNNNVDLNIPPDDLFGIHHNKKDGISLENCQDVDDTEVNEISGNEIHNNGNNGIHLDTSHLVKIIKEPVSNNINKIYDNEENGIYLEGSDVNTIEENEIYNTDNGNQQNGIYLFDSNSNSNIDYNEIYNNKADGILLEGSNDNTFQGNEIYNIYWVDHQQNGIHLKDRFVPPSTYIPSTFNKIQLNNIIRFNKKNGVFLENSNNNEIIGNNIYNNLGDGTYLEDSDSNLITGNEIHNLILNVNPEENQQNGVHLLNSDQNDITDNNADLNNDGAFGIHHNFGHGIYLESSDGNTIERNNINQNGYSVDYFAGIFLYSSSSNPINENVILQHDWWGIILHDDSDGNTILRNRIQDNLDWGIAIPEEDCNNNQIYHNNFIDNNPSNPKPSGAGQASDCGSNIWSNGYPSGGNHWSDWTEYDGFNGTRQDIPGSDGIVNSGDATGGLNPYTIHGSTAQDDYPFVNELPYPSWW